MLRRRRDGNVPMRDVLRLVSDRMHPTKGNLLPLIHISIIMVSYLVSFISDMVIVIMVIIIIMIIDQIPNRHPTFPNRIHPAILFVMDVPRRTLSYADMEIFY